jgi:PPOX class probable F420-dependent enzyme
MQIVERPSMPADYGIATGDEGHLPWSWVEELLVAARSYWVCTTRDDGRPHAMPVWGLWLGDRLQFSTDPTSLKGRNLTARPDIVVHLESGDDVVVIEGRVTPMQSDRVGAFCDAYDEKYAYRPQPDNPAYGLYELAPDRVLAWREADFPTSATRFRRTLSP